MSLYTLFFVYEEFISSSRTIVWDNMSGMVTWGGVCLGGVGVGGLVDSIKGRYTHYICLRGIYKFV